MAEAFDRFAAHSRTIRQHVTGSYRAPAMCCGNASGGNVKPHEVVRCGRKAVTASRPSFGDTSGAFADCLIAQPAAVR